MAFYYAKRGGTIMDWFKAYQDGLLRGSLCATDNTTQLVWMKLLAVENETRLRDGWLHYAPGRPMTREYLAMVCQVTVAELELALQEFLCDLDREGHPRIEINAEGEIFIKNWEKYQAKPEKTIAKEQSIEKARATRRTQDNAVMALVRTVNRLNLGLQAHRYEVTPDGKVLDTTTGEVKEVGEVKQ